MSDVTFANAGNLKLSRVIPQHVHSVSFNWCDRSFSVMSPDWRRVRTKMGKGTDSCRWCKHEFVDGDTIALAQPSKGANWLLCSTCAEMILRRSDSAGTPP